MDNVIFFLQYRSDVFDRIMSKLSLSVHDLQCAYRDIRVLPGVDLKVTRISVAESNGAGRPKSLLALSGKARMQCNNAGSIAESLFRRQPRQIFAGDMLDAFHRRDRASTARDPEFIYSIFPVLKALDWHAARTLSGREEKIRSIGCCFLGRLKPLMMVATSADGGSRLHVHPVNQANRGYHVVTGRSWARSPLWPAYVWWQSRNTAEHKQNPRLISRHTTSAGSV